LNKGYPNADATIVDVPDGAATQAVERHTEAALRIDPNLRGFPV
jgi:hypothetical protein